MSDETDPAFRLITEEDLPHIVLTIVHGGMDHRVDTHRSFIGLSIDAVLYRLEQFLQDTEMPWDVLRMQTPWMTGSVITTEHMKALSGEEPE